MKTYIRAQSIDLWFQIYETPESQYPIYKGRADSYMTCNAYLDEYKKMYGSSCVISIKNLGQNKWIVWKKATV